jgi:hypothetical protein
MTMKKFTANYSNTNHNFVIQNLLGKLTDPICLQSVLLRILFKEAAQQYCQDTFGHGLGKLIYRIHRPSAWLAFIRQKLEFDYK